LWAAAAAASGLFRISPQTRRLLAAVLHPVPPQPTTRSAIKLDPQRSALQLGVVREGIQSAGDV
jgi:hypothetical protein